MYTFEQHLTASGEFGLIEHVHHPIVQVSGLPGAQLHEIVIFEDGTLGQIFLLERDRVQVLVFSNTPLSVGARVTRSQQFISVPVGNELLGSVIDPLGTQLSGVRSNPSTTMEHRFIDSPPPPMATRSRIKQPFLSGVTLIDMMIPLGKGQKELIIGDRKTGKSAFLLSTIKNQVLMGSVAIYVAIAKKKSDIKKIEAFFQKERISQHVVIVATTSYDSPSLVYLTPFAAMTIAEYFRDQGKNVVIVMDDLSTHAKFYREISLLSNRFPGRDSYPGDIFYTHARLLERAGNFKHKNGSEVSITVLPIAEIVEGDFTGYIATNLMGMTDGHIFFDSNLYYQGRRPAVNILLSVTRVGRQAQSDVLRSINRELTSFFALYENMQNLSHFGSELKDNVKTILKTGDALYKMFDQLYSVVVPLDVQLILFAMVWLKMLTDEELDNIHQYRDTMIHAYTDPKVQQFCAEITAVDTLNRLLNSVSKKRTEVLNLCKTQIKQ